MSGDVTVLLQRWADGDRSAFEALLPMVYEELRRLARLYMKGERRGHTFQPTDLVHEAYLRLAGVREITYANRAHFYGAAANVMRRVLVDHARRKKARKRDGSLGAAADLDGPIDPRTDIEALDEALAELARIAPEQTRVVELRYFGGLSVEETGEALGLSPATVKRYWAFARAWLFRRLSGAKASD